MSFGGGFENESLTYFRVKSRANGNRNLKVEFRLEDS